MDYEIFLLDERTGQVMLFVNTEEKAREMARDFLMREILDGMPAVIYFFAKIVEA